MPGQRKTPPPGGAAPSALHRTGGCATETGVFVFDLRHAAAGIPQAGTAAGPCRVSRGVDVERQGVALCAVGGAHLNNGAVGQLDVDQVVVGVNVFFHLAAPYADAPDLGLYVVSSAIRADLPRRDRR